MALAGTAGSAQQRSIFTDAEKPVTARVDDLIQRMTLEEKVSQMQNHAVAIPRLGIPEYDWWNEGLHGVARSGYATVFPQAIGLAATWDKNLMHQVAATISTEARAKNNEALRQGNHSIYYGLDLWSPNINIFRDPRWGRGQETYGEDPFLTSRLGVAFVTGLQGSDPRYYKTISTPKHFAVHSGPENTRHTVDVKVSPHDLEDTYLPAFRATVMEAKAASVMCAYNAVDGQPACANPFLLQDTLRRDWKFDGYITSDCAAITDVAEGHKFSPDMEHAAAVSVRAGTDTSCGKEYAALTKAVKKGLISEDEINTSIRRLFSARIRLGLFDPPSKVSYARIPFSEDDSAEHRALSLHVAEKSMVLLKNDGTLPFGSKVKTIAVIGPNAASLTAIEGNYNAVPSHPVLPLTGMEKQFGAEHILYAQGSPYVAELPLPVPRTILHPATGDAHFGLKGEYFDNIDFKGAPALTRVDEQVDFDWNAAAPDPRVHASGFGVRWTGNIAVPKPGDYQFSFSLAHCYPCGDAEMVRVFLDGKLITDQPFPENVYRPSGTKPFTLSFADIAPHAIRIEYAHHAKLFGAGLSFNWMPPIQSQRDEAVALAKQADVIVAFVGLSPELEGEEMPVHVDGFDGGDRTSIELPAVQQQLLKSLAETGKPLVVVLMNGSAIASQWVKEHAAAILEAWYPGEEGGTAIAQTLTGENNPAGRLPVTFYGGTDQLPAFDDYSMSNRTYRYFHGTPLWGFGYGLSYSKFHWSGLKLSTAKLTAGQPLTLDVDVANGSSRGGDAVSEVYLVPPASALAPLRALVAFERTALQPHQTKHLQITIDPRQLSGIDADGKRSIQPGTYKIFIGGAQPSDDANGITVQFVINETKDLPR
ncbi:MAG TPA: glycoside hydrolase family 3 C-terminal domain-containing protein [Acidobacteriaceae bacterium]